MSLGVRFSVVVLCALSLIVLALYLGLVHRERERLIASKVMAGAMLVDVFARSLQGPLEFRDDDAIGAELHNLDGSPSIRSVVVWADDPEPIARLGSPAPFARPQGSQQRIDDASVILARSVFSRAGAVIGEVLVQLTLNAELATYKRTRAYLLAGAVAIALGTSALLLAVVRHEVVMPLRRVGVVASAIGKGQLTARAAESRGDEIGDLASAFNDMAESLEDRELKLESITQNLRELVDHMRQAIVAFDETGRVVADGSREARRLFGSDDLTGRSIRELLYAERPEFDVDVRAFEEWRSLAFATAPDLWEGLADLAPKELAVGPQQTPVTLEFRPIVRQGRVLHVMLLATDISRERRLELHAQTKEEEYARRLKAMKRLLLDGSQALVSFVKIAEERLAKAEQTVASCGGVLPTAAIDALFRAVHTVRGEARAFDMSRLEREAEALEERLDELRADARGDGYAADEALRTELVSAVGAIRATLYEERDRFAEASPIGRAIFGQTTVQMEDLAALEAYAAGAVGELQALVKRFRARPFGESAALVLESAPAWAALEGKQIDVVVERGDIAVDPDLVPMLPGVLAHLVRNAIAHGIETPGEREEAGKSHHGRIRLAAGSGRDGSTLVMVEDDGRGIDVEALRRLAGPAGTTVEEMLFAPGTSTRREANELAGRGVGLDAVRTDLISVGYTVSVATEPRRFTRFTIGKGPSAPAAGRVHA